MALVLRNCVLVLILLHVTRATDLSSPKAGDCDFEHGLCDYTIQSAHANLTWALYQAGTSENPSTDHTYISQENGHFVMAHWQCSADHFIPFPWLISPALNVDEKGVCLEFWYRAPNESGLALKIMNDGFTNNWFYWTRPGHHQPRIWLKAEVDIENYMSSPQWVFDVIPNEVANIQFIFEGIKFWFSDFGSIAIDDITTSIGSCPKRPGDCNFKQDRCGWDNPGQQRWTRDNWDGGFMKFAMKASQSHDQEVNLVSEKMTGSQCLRFEYGTRRNVVGVLRIYLLFTNTGNRSDVLWSVTGPVDTTGLYGLGMLPILLPGNEEEYKVVFSIAPFSDGYVEMTLDNIFFKEYDSRVCTMFPESARPVGPIQRDTNTTAMHPTTTEPTFA